MPRGKKTLTGESALPAQAMKGGPYGEGERALESQRRTPMPNRQAGLAPAPAGGAPAPAGGGDPNAALARAMEMMAPSSMIDAPTDRPDEPVNQGLSTQRPMPQANESYYELKALVKQYPYPDLINLLARVESEM